MLKRFRTSPRLCAPGRCVGCACKEPINSTLGFSPHDYAVLLGPYATAHVADGLSFVARSGVGGDVVGVSLATSYEAECNVAPALVAAVQRWMPLACPARCVPTLTLCLP